LLTLSRNLGLILGASAMGAVFAWGVGETLAGASPAALLAGMRLTFLLAAGLMGAGFLVLGQGKAAALGANKHGKGLPIRGEGRDT
jgi:hypothetical protein